MSKPPRPRSEVLAHQKALGERVRVLRRERQLTQLDLARQVGVTNGQISTIERGLSAPSIGTLRRISEALAVPIVDFFDTPLRDDLHVVRRHERHKVTNPQGPEVLEVLAGPPRMPAVQLGLGPDETCHRPGNGEPSGLFLYVLQGQVELSSDDQRFVLKSGDSVVTDARRGRLFHNVGDSTALILEVNSGPLRR